MPCAVSAALPLQLAMRFCQLPTTPCSSPCAFFSCPHLAARHALFQLPTPCSSPSAFSAAQAVQLAIRFFSCPRLASRHALFSYPLLAARPAFFQLPSPCSSPFAFSAAHPLQLAMRFFSCPPLAARHSLFQLPTLCSSPFDFSAAHPLQHAMRHRICPCALPGAFATRPSGCASLAHLALTSSALLACLLLGRAPSPVLRPLPYWSCPVCSPAPLFTLLLPRLVEPSPSPSRPAHKTLSGPTWSGSFPRSRLNTCMSPHSAMCQLLPLQLPVPCRLLCGFSSAARPLQLACSQCFSAKAPAPLLHATGSLSTGVPPHGLALDVRPRCQHLAVCPAAFPSAVCCVPLACGVPRP